MPTSALSSFKDIALALSEGGPDLVLHKAGFLSATSPETQSAINFYNPHVL